MKNTWCVPLGATAIKGTDPFWGHDFLFMDRCTAYVKLKINHILFVKNFWFSMFFGKLRFSCFLRGIFWVIFKGIEVKKHQCYKENKDSFGICIEFLTELRIPNFVFVLFLFQVFSGLKKSNCNFYSNIFPHQKSKMKIGIRSFVRNLMQIPKLSLFFSSIDSFWLLSFWRFKNSFYRRGKCIYMHILSVIRGFWHY